MAISQKRSKRKPTGGRYKATYKQKHSETGSDPTLTKLESRRKRTLRVIGGNQKTRLLAIDSANVLDPKTKTYKVVKIKNVVDNPANRNYIRRISLLREQL